MSLRICSFASGSKGNCCFVSDGNTNILIDLGISATRAEKCLEVLGVAPDGVSVLITHTHSDHVGGLKVFCKKHPAVRVFCQRESAGGITYSTGILPAVCERSFAVGSLKVDAVPASHDVPCFGYVVSAADRSVAVMTDVGKVSKAQLDAFGGCGVVMIEANHDRTMLQANPRYTAMLKARINSEHGHLSNSDCAAACAFLASGGVRNFILAHLSDENNTPALASDEVKRAIACTGATGVRVVVATQNEMTGLFEVC